MSSENGVHLAHCESGCRLAFKVPKLQIASQAFQGLWGSWRKTRKEEGTAAPQPRPAVVTEEPSCLTSMCRARELLAGPRVCPSLGLGEDFPETAGGSLVPPACSSPPEPALHASHLRTGTTSDLLPFDEGSGMSAPSPVQSGLVEGLETWPTITLATAQSCLCPRPRYTLLKQRA